MGKAVSTHTVTPYSVASITSGRINSKMDIAKMTSQISNVLPSTGESTTSKNQSNPSDQKATVTLTAAQAERLHEHALTLVECGAPQKRGADILARASALELQKTMSAEQQDLIHAYGEGLIAYLLIEGMRPINSGLIPPKLSPLETMENDGDVLYLAARNHILLELVSNRAFAYDLDNEGKIVRIVANYKGGGADSLDNEPADIELSSHSGLRLDPHTEAPYWCSFTPENDHSPAPSTLILTALWNPLEEPTTIIPIAPVLQKIGVIDALALTTKSFNFTRSDSFVSNKGEDGKGVSILDYSEKYGFAARFNSYRFSVDESASRPVKNAYANFIAAVGTAPLEKVILDQTNTVLINNYRSLHCRDIIKDNRRLLVRLFGYCKKTTPIILSQSPMIVKG